MNPEETISTMTASKRTPMQKLMKLREAIVAIDEGRLSEGLTDGSDQKGMIKEGLFMHLVDCLDMNLAVEV